MRQRFVVALVIVVAYATASFALGPSSLIAAALIVGVGASLIALFVWPAKTPISDHLRLHAVIAAQSELATLHLEISAVEVLAAQRAMDLVAATGARIEMVTGTDLVWRAAVGSNAAFGGRRRPIDVDIESVAVKTGATQIVNDALNDPRVESDLASEMNVRSIMCIPLLDEHKTRGLIVATHENPRAFAVRDAETLQLMAGQVLAAIVNAEQYERTREAEELQRYLAEHDALTGLPNRTLFFDRLSQAVRAARRSEERIAVLYVDLDRFKAVNDSLGHEAGDLVLREAASRLSQTLRESDTVARLGGDEFALLLPAIAGDGIDTVLAKLYATFSVPFPPPFGAILSLSIGCAFFPDDSRDVAALVRIADEHMYKEKARKRTLVT